MDTSTLTPLITALRSETQENAISPESLGALLQKIVDVLNGATPNTDFNNLLSWKNGLSAMPVLVNVAPVAGSSNVEIRLTKFNLVNNQQVQGSYYINAVTTSYAGVMTPTQLQTLNQCATDINNLQNFLQNLQIITSTQNAPVEDGYTSADNRPIKFLKLNNQVFYPISDAKAIIFDSLGETTVEDEIIALKNRIVFVEYWDDETPAMHKDSASPGDFFYKTDEGILYVAYSDEDSQIAFRNAGISHGSLYVSINTNDFGIGYNTAMKVFEFSNNEPTEPSTPATPTENNASSITIEDCDALGSAVYSNFPLDIDFEEDQP